MIIVTSSFSKRFPFTLNEKPAFSNFSGLKSVFEELCFYRGGLVWTVGLTVESKLCLQLSPA